MKRSVPYREIVASCMEYYASDENRQRLYNSLNDPLISIRIIEYFITHYYALKPHEEYPWHNHSIAANCPSNYYPTCLEVFTKRYFDPCCRHVRHYIPLQDNTLMQTTIAQLNFFRWFFLCGVDKYLRDHYVEINNARKLGLSGKHNPKHIVKRVAAAPAPAPKKKAPAADPPSKKQFHQNNDMWKQLINGATLQR